MLITEYLTSEHDICWDHAKQCGIDHAVIRLPESGFDITNRTHWDDLICRFTSFGLTPVVVEPLPNSLHDHIKTGDELRDESLEKLLAAIPLMAEHGIKVLCFNFMAHVGWTRNLEQESRGGAIVTGFDLNSYIPEEHDISEARLWDNYRYFIDAVLPEAERCGLKLALHPDDPPLSKLGSVSRIMCSYENIKRAVDMADSDHLGITLCQACFYLMGKTPAEVLEDLREKTFFVHFRNVKGTPEHFFETFHDDGDIDMAEAIRLYSSLPAETPIRVDHVPLMAGEQKGINGYTALGRLFADGYLKGLLEGVDSR